MSLIRLRSTPIALALLATLLLVPSVAAAAPRSSPAVHAAAGSSFLTYVWHTLQSLWGAAGMIIDPNGAHVDGTPATGGGTTSFTSGSLPEGVSIDPNGQHLTNPSGTANAAGGSLPEGTTIDPHG
ncbi:MAG TPA: hypothetical protein VIH93_08950 [Thermoanaerobaculia bacterium]|jgi:hypothetical protein